MAPRCRDPAIPTALASASLVINPGKNQVCWALATEGIDDITAARIHRGAPTVAGPIAVVLPLPAVAATCTTVPREILQAILKNPSNYYVNVHNAEYKDGALRGQLAKGTANATPAVPNY